MKKTQAGFSAIEGFLILIILGMIGFAGWYVWDSKNNANKSFSSASTVSSTSTKLSPAVQKPIDNKIILKKMGIEFTVPVSLSSVVFTEGASTGDPPNYPIASFTTQKLKAIGNCPSLVLFKVPGTYPSDANTDNTPGVLVKQFSNYYIAGRGLVGACFDDPKNNEEVLRLGRELSDPLKTIQELK